jgi:hypothetical protein
MNRFVIPISNKIIINPKMLRTEAETSGSTLDDVDFEINRNNASLRAAVPNKPKPNQLS